jgi:hypothetical protein
MAVLKGSSVAPGEGRKPQDERSHRLNDEFKSRFIGHSDFSQSAENNDCGSKAMPEAGRAGFCCNTGHANNAGTLILSLAPALPPKIWLTIQWLIWWLKEIRPQKEGALASQTRSNPARQ